MIDECAYHPIVASLYAAPLRPELWTTALKQLAKAIGARQAALLEHDHGKGIHRIFAFVGDPLIDGGRLYQQHYWKHDEWTRRFPKTPIAGALVFGESIWPDEFLKTSLFYNEFLLKHAVSRVIGVPSYGTGGEFGCLSVYLEPDAADFDGDQCRALRSLAAYIDTALNLRRRLLELEGRIQDLEAALHQLRCGLIVVDRSGKPLMVNDAAQKITANRQSLLITKSGISTVGAREAGELRALIGRVTSITDLKDTHRSGGLVVSCAGGGALHVLVTPVPPGVVGIRSSAAAIVLILDLARDKSVPPQLLRQLYSLFPAESRWPCS